jgi:predicted DNA-binding protein (UPF0251 family)
MTPDQFNALSALLGGSSQQVREALRLVLVEGMRQADAARQAGATRQALNRRMRQAAKIMGHARRIVGVSQGSSTSSPNLDAT